jgi:pyridoxal phosphate enzyme (YggS family)
VPIEWHFIGALQRRKVRQLAGRFALIHSVDRLELGEEMDRRLESGKQAILVQVNCSGEAQKSGIAPAGLPALLDQLRDLARLEVRGLMTMAALDARESELHRTFAMLRQLRDAAVTRGHVLPDLSMGMSDDFPIAVEEGATMLRLGSILFGPRQVAG